jgi:hypothetical protein
VREQTFPCLSRLVGSGNIRRSLVYSSEWENSCLGTATGLSARRLPGKYIGDLSLRADNVAASWPLFLQRFFVGVPTTRGRQTGVAMGCLVQARNNTRRRCSPSPVSTKHRAASWFQHQFGWKGSLSSLVLACIHVPAQYLNPARQDSGFTFTAEDLAGNSPSE